MTLADRPGTDPWEVSDWRVLMLIDRYDEDMGREWVTVHATGPFDAENHARLVYPDGSPLRVELA